VAIKRRKVEFAHMFFCCRWDSFRVLVFFVGIFGAVMVGKEMAFGRVTQTHSRVDIRFGKENT
jgi:hypothetical protein